MTKEIIKSKSGEDLIRKQVNGYNCMNCALYQGKKNGPECKADHKGWWPTKTKHWCDKKVFGINMGFIFKSAFKS